MKLIAFLSGIIFYTNGQAQPFDSTKYSVSVTLSDPANFFFTKNPAWRGADGASCIDLQNGKLLWLFSDGFICPDQSGSRKTSTIIRNSIAVQDGHDLETASLQFYWDKSKPEPQAFFHIPGPSWFWTGHGTMIKDKLLVFLIKEQKSKQGLGYEAQGWYLAIISNPGDNPEDWKIQYIEGPETFGTIAGSGAVLKDERYLYALGAVEPDSHEVFPLRWTLIDAYNGHIARPEWWINHQWTERKDRSEMPDPLFIGATEYSVHYDSSLKKFIQIQSYGFGKASIGLRMADSLQGKWTEPYIFYTPDYSRIKKPFMYSAKAHPELQGDGTYITYNINSFEFSELIENPAIYFPKFVLVRISTLAAE